MRIFRPLLMVVICFGLAAFMVSANAQTRVETDYTKTEIIPEASGFVPGQTLWFAIRQDLSPGWHVFWVNPGDAGLPLRLEWTMPSGFTAGEVLHPAPEYIPVGPLASYAHEGAPAFLVPVTAPVDAEPGDSIDISINAFWQTCEDICVPEEGRFSFVLPVLDSPVVNDDAAGIFGAARASLPVTYDDATASFSIEGSEYKLSISAPDGAKTNDAFFFPEPEGLIEPSAPQRVELDGDRLTVAMKPGWLAKYDKEALSGVLTYKDMVGARHSVAVTAQLVGPIEKPSLAVPQLSAQRNFNTPLLLLLAFLGGVLLNIMPCVFPVVFIKAASFVQSARENPAIVRQNGLLYTAGVLVTFLSIGGLLLALRAGGEQFGWGFHLQSPVIMTLSAYVLLLVGLNLAGLFSVGQSITGKGETLASKGGGAGAFFTGALAVVVAAPCIGPLMSAPMGAALLLPAASGLMIFAALGLGLAAPYLALSFAPGLGRRLPKPGPWMVIFKQALAFPVFAAAAYFLWVLTQQTSGAGLGAVMAGAVLLAFAAWSFEHSKGEGGLRFILRIVAALAVVAALAPLFRIETALAPSQSSLDRYGAMEAEPFNADAIAAYRSAKTPVFVDFTAAWCVTCQFDKVTIFSDEVLAREFPREGIVFMVGDWTVRDPQITRALAEFGASGVPFYVFYPKGEEPQVLTPPLTKQAVRRAVLRSGL